MKRERRRRRSERLRDALHLQLEACAQNYGVPSMSLGDERGLIVAGAGHWEDVDEALVAFAPLLCRVYDRGERARLVSAMREMLPRLPHDHVSVRRFQSGGQRLYLCAMGQRSRHKDVAMMHAISGLRRILKR